ncbi:MAG: hydantoinase B/oxoprolinase family protein [Gammaproteobacteria bacterium]|nr:hydantoinase B/oxoprolinase family protein [Gammaproteobacteria bacterium]
MSIDKITLQVLANHCAAATESMAHTLVRTAHSTFVKETEDFTTGLATRAGQTFASPYSLGATWFVGLDYAGAIELIDSYEEGDLCITNDPYSGYVCTHSPDVHLWKPIFHEGELICFAVGHVHNTDVGGAVPASLSRANTEVHQEGIRIPPQKLYRRGELNQELLDILMLNVRMPEQNWGDLKAQVAAMKTGERKVHEMIARFGLEDFKRGIEDLLDHAEQQARHLISKIPNGNYFFADYMDEDSVAGKPCRIAVDMAVRDDRINFDFSGSDPQLASALNIPTGGNPRHVLLMIPYIYILYSMDRSLLLNAGVLRPAHSDIPLGSVVNPEFPAAVGMRSLGTMRLQTCVFGAFAQAMPDFVPAACGDGGPLINLRTSDPISGRRLMANLDPITGGGGGSALGDGPEGAGGNFGFLKNTPVEINEAEVPVKILSYGLAPDSGGPGQWRGGCGSALKFQVSSPNSVVTARNRDRTTFTPWGMRGGQAGRASSFVKNPGTNRESDLGNTDVVNLGPGEVIEIKSAGAGGWGDPRMRDPARVLRDVLAGFVSPQSALDDYAVVIRDAAVDTAATSALRATAARPDNHRADGFGYNAARLEFEARWTRANYDALGEVLSELPTNWRFFVKHRVFEALEKNDAEQHEIDKEAVIDACRAVMGEFPELATYLNQIGRVTR